MQHIIDNYNQNFLKERLSRVEDVDIVQHYWGDLLEQNNLLVFVHKKSLVVLCALFSGNNPIIDELTIDNFENYDYLISKIIQRLKEPQELNLIKLVLSYKPELYQKEEKREDIKNQLIFYLNILKPGLDSYLTDKAIKEERIFMNNKINKIVIINKTNKI